MDRALGHTAFQNNLPEVEATPENTMDNGRPVQLPVTPDIQTQAPPDQPVQPGQRVYDQSTPGHQEQPQAGQGLDLTIDTDFLKSPLCYIKIAEFVVLLCAWASVVKYLDDFYQLYPDYQTDDKEARYFNFIAIFCWVMVILCLVIKTFSVPSFCKWRRPSVFTAMEKCYREIIGSFRPVRVLFTPTGHYKFQVFVYKTLEEGDIDLSDNKAVERVICKLRANSGFVMCPGIVDYDAIDADIRIQTSIVKLEEWPWRHVGAVKVQVMAQTSKAARNV
ncbi:hypothetical protein ACROYT_G013538 [Oculina patagonica]